MSAVPQVKRVSIIRKLAAVPNRIRYSQRAEVLARAFAQASLPAFLSEDLNRIVRELVTPNRAAHSIRRLIEGDETWVHVTGTVEDRVVFLGIQANTAIVCSLGRPLVHLWESMEMPPGTLSRHWDDQLATCTFSEKQRQRLTLPRVLLVALYHPENFPLPRFPLGISDLARALRKQMIGTVDMMDMQFGASVHDIVQRIGNERFEVLGISATFGQHDLLEEILSAIHAIAGYTPTIIVGGSLAALNFDSLLRRKLAHAVATGPGERAMQDVVRAWAHGIAWSEVTDIAYFDVDAGEIKRTRKLSNRKYDDILPELDMLDVTLKSGGVLQLESSRGCSYACSFCPREHKGMWAGEDAKAIDILLPDVLDIFLAYPHIDRRIFLVDEEFVGYETDDLSLTRCLDTARAIANAGFRFETSSRVDQVYRTRKPRDWHLRRMQFWLDLKKNGLERCLFGIESGVDSILERFNKKTTSEQNITALRLLTSLEIPTRCTYITFDPLMSFEELVETYTFLGRRDLIMKPRAGAPLGEVFDGVHDPAYVEQHSAKLPFFHQVSYMLVSIEALINSPYLAAVEQAGLAGDFNLLMGRRDARFVDERIGRLSHMGQLWVDRSFSLDYLLKSIDKTCGTVVRDQIRKMRVLIKIAAYEVLGLGLLVFKAHSAQIHTYTVLRGAFVKLSVALEVGENEDYCLEALLDWAFADLVAATWDMFRQLEDHLPKIYADAIHTQLSEWSKRSKWKLINGACE